MYAPDIVSDFLAESNENLDQLDRDLVSLEQEPECQATLAAIFRTIHTLKGTCGFLGYGKLEAVTHAGENLLSKLRDGELAVEADITSGLLALVDAVREMLVNIERQGDEGSADYDALVLRLVALQDSATPSDQTSVYDAPTVEIPVEAPEGPRGLDSDASDERTVAGQPREAAGADARMPAVSDSTIRVDVGLLDKLMNRVGELVLARNQILQFCGSVHDTAFLSTSQRLNLITTELQEGVMKTRMQPIGNIWSKFPRVVRDVAHHCGKQVRIDMEGRETELDKTIVEAIKDPLVHLVRNAIDHGIEPPDARAARGKPTEGRLSLRAFHEGGQVNIEIADDGAGLDLQRIRDRAVERGLVSREQAAGLSQRETFQLIFTPGFSTAAQVTNVSGRGVGMDVVKTNIERIGGTVDVQSQPGLGTTVRLKIPLTLAIIPALVVTCAQDRYAIPQVSLLELVRLDREAADRGIEMLHGAPVYRLRGQLLPIVYLRDQLQLAGGDAMALPKADARDEAVNIVVLQAGRRQFGLVVDSINDTEEIVVKPLSSQLKGISVYAGATIMGDGKVALILDVLGIAQQASVVSERRDRAHDDHPPGEPVAAAASETRLVVTVGRRRLALPISLVARLEEISPQRVEQSDGRQVVQYRGQILELVRLADVLNIEAAPVRDDHPLQVVVYNDPQRSVGLVVDEIVDTVDTQGEVQQPAFSEGLLASVVIHHQVTDLVDLPAVVRRAGQTRNTSNGLAANCKELR